MAAMLKQTGVGAKAYPRRFLCAGELRASWLAAGKFCVSHYISIEGHKAGAHSPITALSPPASLFTLPSGQGQVSHAARAPSSFITQQPISNRDLGHGTCLNKAVSWKSLHSLKVWTVTSAAL